MREVDDCECKCSEAVEVVVVEEAVEVVVVEEAGEADESEV